MDSQFLYDQEITCRITWVWWSCVEQFIMDEFSTKISWLRCLQNFIRTSSCGIWISVFQKTLTWVVMDGFDESYHGYVMQNVWLIRWLVALVSNFLLLGVETIKLHYGIVGSTDFRIIHQMHCLVLEWEWSSCSTGVVRSIEFGFDPFYLDVLHN